MERNHEKLATAAQAYYRAMDERMTAAEGNLSAAPLRLAHLLARWRVHSELLAAATHRLASRDVAAIAAAEALNRGWEPEALERQQEAAGPGWGAAGGEAVADLREAVLEELRRRPPKSMMGPVRRKGWVSHSAHWGVVRGGVLELYDDSDAADRGLPPADAFRLDKVDFAGETRPGASKRCVRQQQMKRERERERENSASEQVSQSASQSVGWRVVGRLWK